MTPPSLLKPQTLPTYSHIGATGTADHLTLLRPFQRFLSFLSLLLLSKCSNDLLQHCPCPPARDWGSRVSGLVFFHPQLLPLACFTRILRARIHEQRVSRKSERKSVHSLFFFWWVAGWVVLYYLQFILPLLKPHNPLPYPVRNKKRRSYSFS